MTQVDAETVARRFGRLAVIEQGSVQVTLDSLLERFGDRVAAVELEHSNGSLCVRERIELRTPESK